MNFPEQPLPTSNAKSRPSTFYIVLPRAINLKSYPGCAANIPGKEIESQMALKQVSLIPAYTIHVGP